MLELASWHWLRLDRVLYRKLLDTNLAYICIVTKRRAMCFVYCRGTARGGKGG